MILTMDFMYGLGANKSPLEKSKLIINIIIVILITLITGFHCIAALVTYHYLFSWHVIFGSLAYCFLMPMSIMIFDELLLTRYTRIQKSKIHGIIVTVAMILAALSIPFDYFRQESNKSFNPEIIHFKSNHAITGLISLILYILATFSGLFTYNITWFQEVMVVKPLVLKLFHNLMGLVAYILGMICVTLPLYHPWFPYHYTEFLAIVITILLAIITTWGMINLFLSAYNQRRIAMSENRVLSERPEIMEALRDSA